ncbi:DUF1173 family protein [Pseudomonas oryzihabitans]|uniref:DUF1173 family protein n=1 Tax=Pseudomonas oryzihabitans TaxID=47885 RepID=UPI0007D94463|nr:DUF1173 family protein [Pseudomonas oryzihabitans]
MYASRICIGKALLVSTKTKATVDANETIVADAAKHHRRLIAIGKLESYDSAKQQLKLQCPFGMPFFKVTPDIWERTIKSYRKAIGAHEKGYSVVAILQTDKPVVGKKCTTANVLNVALMIVSDEWIPVESGYELFIERMLRAQKRSFIKPMRFDCKVNPVFPDFWLTDSVSGGHIPMEVYGLDDPKYLARKAAKAVIYNTKYTPAGWWHWNAYLDKKCAAIPPFPL